MAKTKENKTQSPNKKKTKTPTKADSTGHGPAAPPHDDEPDATISEIVNGSLDKQTKKKGKGKREREGGDEQKGSDCRFPMNRIRRIVKSEDSGVHVSQDSIFLINKASEMFLELFSKEAYACATSDKKKHVEYKHLSAVVSKQKMFDFLSDFVPEKVKAVDALAELSSAGI